MGISKKKIDFYEQYSSDDIDRLIRMGWEDRTTFEAILKQFSMTQNQFIQFMRHHLDRNTFKRWRARAKVQSHLKQEKMRGFKVTRFKCSRQSVDGITKGWK